MGMLAVINENKDETGKKAKGRMAFNNTKRTKLNHKVSRENSVPERSYAQYN